MRKDTKGWREDTKGGRTQREEGHKGRKDAHGERTLREGGHEGRKDTKGGNVAVLGIIADGGRAIVVIYREAVEINGFLIYIKTYNKPFNGGLVQPLPKRLPGVGCIHLRKPCR